MKLSVVSVSLLHESINPWTHNVVNIQHYNVSLLHESINPWTHNVVNIQHYNVSLLHDSINPWTHNVVNIQHHATHTKAICIDFWYFSLDPILSYMANDHARSCGFSCACPLLANGCLFTDLHAACINALWNHGHKQINGLLYAKLGWTQKLINTSTLMVGCYF